MSSIIRALIVAVVACATTEAVQLKLRASKQSRASSETESEATGGLWPFDAVGAWVNILTHGTFSSPSQPAVLASTEDSAVGKATGKVSVPKTENYWVNDIDESGVINVKLNSQLQLMPGKVKQLEEAPTPSLLVSPFEAIGSLFRKLQTTLESHGFLAAATEVSTAPAEKHRESVEQRQGGAHRNESGVIEVTLESELQTNEGAPTLSLLQFWPLEAVASFFHNLTSRPPEQPLDLPELTATKSFVSKENRSNRINETGILVVPLASELQVETATGVTPKRLRDTLEGPVGISAAVRYPRVLFVSACLAVIGLMQIFNSCVEYSAGFTVGVQKMSDDAATEKLLTPRKPGRYSSSPSPRSLRSPRILPSPRSLKSPRINPEYGSCGPSASSGSVATPTQRPVVPKLNLDVVREAMDDDEDTDVKAIRGGF